MCVRGETISSRWIFVSQVHLLLDDGLQPNVTAFPPNYLNLLHFNRHTHGCAHCQPSVCTMKSNHLHDSQHASNTSVSNAAFVCFVFLSPSVPEVIGNMPGESE